MSKTLSKPALSKSAPTAPLLVFGVDEANKPRAARFLPDKPQLVAKAAQLMNLKIVEANTPALVEVVEKLPTGRLYANERAFVPYIRHDLYAKILELTGV